MRVDFGKALLAHGQRDGFVARGRRPGGEQLRLRHPAVGEPGQGPGSLRNPAAAQGAVGEGTHPRDEEPGLKCYIKFFFFSKVKALDVHVCGSAYTNTGQQT